jgi:hypothetical protein
VLEADRSPPSSVDVKNAYVFTAWCLNKPSYAFTFTRQYIETGTISKPVASYNVKLKDLMGSMARGAATQIAAPKKTPIDLFFIL